MKINHIGYAVKKIEKAKKIFEEMGYTFGNIIEDFDRNIYISFGEMGGYVIELVSPMSGKDSPVDTYLKKNGSTPYHICYESEDLEKDIHELEKNNFKIIVPPAKAIAFSGRRVVFMYHVMVGLIEIVER